MKLIESFKDFPMKADKNEITKHNYIRFRLGRLKHNLWLKSRKDPDNVYVDSYDNFIIKNLKPGRTCYFCSAGYYVSDLIDNLTVAERHPIVKSFYPDAIIVDDRKEIAEKFPETFDNFVVVNNRGDIWATLDMVEEHVSKYVGTMKPGCIFFYSFRDTQIVDWNRLKHDHYQYFLDFGKRLEKNYGLNLLWHDIRFANKQQQADGSYDILENPDTTNGNIKFIFQYKQNNHKLDLSCFNP